MDSIISTDDRKKIEDGIRAKYINVAHSPEGQFRYPTGLKGLEALGYEKALIDRLPSTVASSYCGVGNPFSLGDLWPGEQVLDIGCGAGIDTILAAIMVGPKGSATGIDIVPEMIDRAESNLQLLDVHNASFQLAAGEKLPFPNDSFDVVISNGAINLIPAKKAAVFEVIRVLKKGGRLMVADQIAVKTVQKDIKERLANWFQ